MIELPRHVSAKAAVSGPWMANPDLVLMDEPSEGLSPKLIQQIEEIMHGLRDRGHSILLVEQNFDLAMSVADYVYIIASGRIVAEGEPGEVRRDTQMLDRHLGIA